MVPFIVGAGALVLLGGAVGFEVAGRSSYDDARAELDDQARRDSLEDSANRKRLFAQGLAVTGVAAAGVAIWLYIRSHGETSTQIARSPRLAVSLSGIALVGAF
jgi:hypothetical protein